MGRGLRGTSKVSNSSNNAGGPDQAEVEALKKVEDGRNRLKNMVSGELNLRKSPQTMSSHISSLESQD